MRCPALAPQDSLRADVHACTAANASLRRDLAQSDADKAALRRDVVALGRDRVSGGVGQRVGLGFVFVLPPVVVPLWWRPEG